MRAKGIVVAAACVGVFAYALSASAEPSENSEVLRIRSHFDSVLVELSRRDTRELTAAQRGHRVHLVETLKRYRDRGVFPRNYDFPGQAVPYFVDRKTGTLCAVAHLLESTGRRDIVDRVAQANNNVAVAELQGDSVFENWLDANGLTLQEAARIQPAYGGPPTRQEVAHNREIVSSGASVGVAGVTAINLITNRDGHGRVRNWIGIGSGVASIGIGLVVLLDPVAHPGFGLVSVAIGTLSTTLSMDALLRHRAFEARRKAEGTRVALAPTVATSGGAGLAISLRF
jgi:hypothetical protein